jgi:hypothetical protein
MADPLESCGKWFIPEPSLTAQLEREMDRHKAKKLEREDIGELADKLIVDWYQHEATINLLLGRVRQLEVELVLKDSKPSKKQIDKTYLDMAKSLFNM